MPRDVTFKVYTFDELSESAKESARNWWRQSALGYGWWGCIYDDFLAILAKLGFSVDAEDVHFSGFSSQGDGASFTGSYSYSKGALKAIKAHAPQDSALHRITERLQDMQRRNFYRVTGSISRHVRYCHEMTMQCDVDRYDGVDWPQDSYNEAQEIFEDCARDLARWLYANLESEYRFQMEDEQVDDSIRVNEYEFTGSGSIA